MSHTHVYGGCPCSSAESGEHRVAVLVCGVEVDGSPFSVLHGRPHSATTTAQLASAAVVIAGRAFDFAVVSRDRRNQPMR